MTYDCRVLVAPGAGLLARRGGALLYVADSTDASDLIDGFRTADHDALVECLADHVLTRPSEAPSFVFIQWPADVAGQRVHIVVRGDGVITSDISSVPSLSGTGSSTWVEHRVLRNPQHASIRSGGDAHGHTELVDGVVPAGGFEWRLASPAFDSSARPSEPDVLPRAERLATSANETFTADDELTVSDLDETVGAQHDTEVAEPPGTASSKAAQVDRPDDGLDLLEQAAGGDWMDESLQLDPAHRPAAPEDDPVSDASATQRSVDPRIGDEPHPAVTTASHDAADADGEDADGEDADGAVVDDADAPGPRRRRPGAPTFPGDLDPDTSSAAVDTEVTLEPVASAALHTSGPSVIVADRVTHARLCPMQHPNPPQAERCRLCDAAIDPDASTVTVDQPTLATVTLPDGTQLALNTELVLGRRPDPSDARSEFGTAVPFDAPSSVSRTHLKLSVDGWRLYATDCGSRGGSALIPAGGHDPVPLEPWMPHEVDGGDRLFLGGPTEIVLHEVDL